MLGVRGAWGDARPATSQLNTVRFVPLQSCISGVSCGFRQALSSQMSFYSLPSSSLSILLSHILSLTHSFSLSHPHTLTHTYTLQLSHFLCAETN